MATEKRKVFRLTRDQYNKLLEGGEVGNDEVGYFRFDENAIYNVEDNSLIINSIKFTGTSGGNVVKDINYDSSTGTLFIVKGNVEGGAQGNFLEKYTGTGENYLYAVNKSGEQEMIYFDNGINGDSIAQRTSGGQLEVASPTAASHAATKEYVDNLIISVLNGKS